MQVIKKLNIYNESLLRMILNAIPLFVYFHWTNKKHNIFNFDKVYAKKQMSAQLYIYQFVCIFTNNSR